jgi:hypothetical protein
MKLFKNLNNVTDVNVYVAHDKKTQIPSGFVEAAFVYHVVEIPVKEMATDQEMEEASDYSVSHSGRKHWFKFSSQEGRLAFNRNSSIVKTTDRSAITCPMCMEACDVGDRVKILDKVAEPTKKPPKPPKD